MNKGKLYIVATPIGNLGDLSPRAVETLKNVDIILCEDTRHSGRLLNHFEIKNKLMSYHEHNEKHRSDQLVDDILSGKNIAIISDAGSPGISDPGSVFVDTAHKNAIQVVPIPGPSAVVSAVSACGFSAGRFQFIGFLSRKASEKQKEIEDTINYSGLSIIYESPNRLLATLELIKDTCPERQVVVARELTKLNEEIFRGSIEETCDHFAEGVKGEIVIVLNEFYIEEKIDIEKELLKKLDQGYSKSQAVKLVSKEFSINKNEVYDISISITNID